MMLNTPRKVKGIEHPLVGDMYLKKTFGEGGLSEDVLVIETRFYDWENETEHEAHDDYMIDLLIDLENLKSQAQERVGYFDRIDIRAH